MAEVNTSNLERLVHKADEFALLDEITQKALTIAKAIIVETNKEAEKEEKHETND